MHDLLSSGKYMWSNYGGGLSHVCSTSCIFPRNRAYTQLRLSSRSVTTYAQFTPFKNYYAFFKSLYFSCLPSDMSIEVSAVMVPREKLPVGSERAAMVKPFTMLQAGCNV